MDQNSIIKRITKEQIDERLKTAKEQNYLFQTNGEIEKYKQNYYRDMITLEKKLTLFSRYDKLFKDADDQKKEKIEQLIDKRKELKQRENDFYQNVSGLRNRITNSSLPSILQGQNNNNNFMTPQKPIKEDQNNVFRSTGRQLSSSNQRSSFHNNYNAIQFEELKNFRFLNERLPTHDEIKTNTSPQMTQLITKSPYVNNIVNLTNDGNVNSQRQIVTYLKAILNDLSLQCSVFSHGSIEYKEKQSQIEHIKQILQFIDKKNPYKPQAEINSDPSEYMQDFYINWDFVKFLPSYVKRVKINYGMFKRESTFFTYRWTSDHYTHNQNYLDTSPDRQSALINEQHVIQSMVSRQNVVLYLDLWVWDQTDENITKYGWSLLDIFDTRGNFLPGKYKIPFYPKEVKAHQLFQNGLRYLNYDCFCFLNLQTQKSSYEYNKQQFDFESEYYIPPLHQKPQREEIIYQHDSLNIFTSADDMPIVGIPKKPSEDIILKELTYEMIMKECGDVKLQKQMHSQTMTSFTQISEKKIDIPSQTILKALIFKNLLFQIKYLNYFNKLSLIYILNIKRLLAINKINEEDDIGFEITITGFTNIFFSQTEFIKIKGAFMKYDNVIQNIKNQIKLNQLIQQVIVDEKDKRTTNQDYILTSKDLNNQLKCEYDVHYNVDFDHLNIDGYNEFQQSGEKEFENEYYLFFCFYNQNDRLIGWTDVDLFDIENKKVILKQGKFQLQLFNPPLLKPPFFGPKTCSIIEMKYEIIGNQEVKEKKKKREELKKTMMATNKRQVKNYEEGDDEQQQLLDEQRKTEQELNDFNEKQIIKIEITTLKNYIFSRNTFGCNIKFVLGSKVLQDSKNKTIQYQDNLDIQSTEKNIFNFSHERDIDINVGALKKQIPDKEKDKAMIYIEIVLTNKKNEQLGYIEIPIFKDKYQISRSESLPLQKKNKDKVSALKYTLDFKIDLFEKQAEKQYDNTMGFVIEIQQINNYREPTQVSFTVKIICGSELLRDVKGNKLDIDSKYPSTTDAKKKVSTFEQSVEIPLNIEMLKDKRKKELFKIYALITFQQQKADKSKEDYGWFAHPLFQNDIFYEGNFEETLYKPPPIEVFPIDPKKMRKLTSKLVFEIKEVKISG